MGQLHSHTEEHAMDIGQRYAIGTRAIVRKAEHDYRVVCATCDAGGSKRYENHAQAFHAAAESSARKCRVCGAE